MKSLFMLVAVAGCADMSPTNDLEPTGPVGGGKGDGACPSIEAGIGVSSPQQFACGPVSARSMAEMADINRFWESASALCACGPDQPDCSNATAMTGGWIYASNDFLEGLRASGSNMPTQYVLAHELGHEIQTLIGVPSITQVKELQADCFAGYYLGSLACRGLARISDVQTTLATACLIADGTGDPVGDLETHGTCAQRTSMVTRGMRGYLAGTSALVTCAP